MKNNKSLLSFGIIALVLFLGVGYAVVNTTNLTIGGTASVQDSQMNVRFSRDVAVAVSNSEKVTATVTDDLNATIAVRNLTVDEPVTATYTIQNYDGDLAAKIATKNITVTPSDYFEVDTEIAGDGTVAAGKETTVTVTVSLVKVPVSKDDSTANISVNLTATPVDPAAQQ